MKEIQTQNEKTCAYCNKILHGRSDQKFCNDSCRNNFNRKKRAAEKVEEHENTPEIFRIIKKNYELLKRGRTRHMDDNEYIMMKTNDFLADGVNPKFITSTFTSENGSVWKCVFEMCFSMGEEHTIIKDFPQQALV